MCPICAPGKLSVCICALDPLLILLMFESPITRIPLSVPSRNHSDALCIDFLCRILSTRNIGIDGDDSVSGCSVVLSSFCRSVSVLLSQSVIDAPGVIMSDVARVPVGVEWILSISVDESVPVLLSSSSFPCVLYCL